MQEYPLIAERGRNEGIPALDQGDFDTAYQLLSAAKTAVDSLGGAVEKAEEIRTAAAEAAIFNDRSPLLLEEMLEEAGRTDPHGLGVQVQDPLSRSSDRDRLDYH